jgi:hypothetical protein
MEVILQVSLCLHELQRLMIDGNDFLLPENIMHPMESFFHNGVNLFIISRVLIDDI